jgi:hypothetical protein
VIFGEPVFYSEDIWSNLEDTAITADLENRVRSLSQTIETLENQR